MLEVTLTKLGQMLNLVSIYLEVESAQIKHECYWGFYTTRLFASVFKDPKRLPIRDEIKKSGKFAIFTRLKIEGVGGQRHIMEKLPLKIQTVKDFDGKMTQNDLEGNRDRK